MTYNKSDLKQLPTLSNRNVKVLDRIERDYTTRSIVYCGDCHYTLPGKITFYKGEFVEITVAKQISKHTAEQYRGSIVEYKTLETDKISNSFVIRYRKQNGKQYASKVLAPQQVIEWVENNPYSYTLYSL